MHLERFEKLVDGYFDVGLTAAELRELSVVLETDSEAREAFWRLAQTHAALREWGLGRAGFRQAGAIPVSPGASVFPPGPGTPDDVGRNGWGYILDHVPQFALAGLLLIIATLAALSVLSSPRGATLPVRPAIANRRGAPAHTDAPRHAGTSEGTTAPVAHLTHVAACRWDERDFRPGDPLCEGQSLVLRSGVAELSFDRGVRMILQGPASLQVESADGARLLRGKLTAEVTGPAARGFRLRTPRATLIDEGTEFGVEVTRDASRVHVFQGVVDLTLDDKRGLANPLQRLTAKSGARLEGNPPNLTLLEDTGESFIRSLDQIASNRHTLAYWRFEDQPLGVVLPDTNEGTNPVRATMDCSFNGNDLFTYSPRHGPRFSGDVPSGMVPRTGAANRGCLDNTAPPEEVPSRDVYTDSHLSHAAPVDLQAITAAEWTIEISIRPKRLGRGAQTFLSRDGGTGERAWLAFRVTDEGRFAITFIDEERRIHTASSSGLMLQENHWYHLAAVSDARMLRLYADCQDGRGYQIQASADLPKGGSTALGKSGPPSREWAVGRTRTPNHDVAEWFQGWIDEVRISDVALRPEEFLFAPGERGKAAK
jgi:hypothetical protein